MHTSRSKKVAKEIRIVLTGGHAGTTAIAVIEELIRRREINWDIYWIGAKKAFEGKSISTLESLHLPKLGVKHYTIISGRLQRKFTPWTIPSLIKIPISFFHAWKVLKQINPRVIISFGGYSAFPVVVAGALKRIPTVIHEQTAAVGRANKLSALFANNLFDRRFSWCSVSESIN